MANDRARKRRPAEACKAVETPVVSLSEKDSRLAASDSDRYWNWKTRLSRADVAVRLTREWDFGAWMICTENELAEKMGPTH